MGALQIYIDDDDDDDSDDNCALHALLFSQIQDFVLVVRERTIRTLTDTFRYEYSSVHNGQYRYGYEYSVRWCPGHLYY